jgi:hypothetical protein
VGNNFRFGERAAEAVGLLRDATNIRERIFGGMHLDTAESLSSLAGVLYDRGDYATARPYGDES